MMKKAVWFILGVALLICTTQSTIKAFDEAYIASDCVPNAETAGNLAVIICEAVYPWDDLNQYNQQIYYYEEKAIWRIHFSLKEDNVTGGGIYLEIKKNNAEVITMARTK